LPLGGRQIGRMLGLVFQLTGLSRKMTAASMSYRPRTEYPEIGKVFREY
jgi:hypothetical protein